MRLSDQEREQLVWLAEHKRVIMSRVVRDLIAIEYANEMTAKKKASKQ